MRSRGRCSGSGRRAGLRRSNARHRDLLAPRPPPSGPPPRPVRRPLPARRAAARAARAARRVPRIGRTARAAAWDRVLELLDQQRAVLRLALGRRRLACAALSACALREDHRLRSREIVRQRISSASSPTMESQIARPVSAQRSALDSQCRDQPAACGRQVCCGIRQSIPSSK